MALEIERKFLTNEQVLPLLQDGTVYRQGYLSSDEKMAVRVRLAGDKAWLTIKGAGRGTVRTEFEYPIPPADADQMLTELVSGPLIDKTRYLIRHDGALWEVDVFEGDNAGLIVAEIELESEHQQVELPPWVAQEVSADSRYLNSNLVKKPFKQW